MNLSFWIKDKEYRLNLVQKTKNEVQVQLGKKVFHVSFEFLNSSEILLILDGVIHSVIINSNTTSHSVCVNGSYFKVEKKSASQILGMDKVGAQKRDVKTSMPGKVIKVLVKEGEKVKQGQAVLILEAMKMQNEIKSPQAGHVVRIVPQAGESVEAGALLFSVE